MKKKIKDVLLTFLILVIIGILVFFNYYYYKLAPQMLNDNQDIEILDIFEESNNLSDLMLESRYAFDEVFYSASDSKYAYIFNKNGALLSKLNKEELDWTIIKEKIKNLKIHDGTLETS